MKTVRLSTRVRQDAFWPDWDDDVAADREDEARLAALDEIDALLAEVADELACEEPPVITTWMVMSERERAQIRPHRRRTPEGMLWLVRGGARQPAARVSDEGEAA